MTLWIRGWLNSRQLNQKDIELDQEVDDIMAADFDAIDADIEADKKDLQDGLKRRVEAVKKGIRIEKMIWDKELRQQRQEPRIGLVKRQSNSDKKR